MGLFYRSQSLIVNLERESQSYFEIAWIIRPVRAAKERRRHDTAVVLVLRVIERVPQIQHECHVRA